MRRVELKEDPSCDTREALCRPLSYSAIGVDTLDVASKVSPRVREVNHVEIMLLGNIKVLIHASMQELNFKGGTEITYRPNIGRCNSCTNHALNLLELIIRFRARLTNIYHVVK